MTIPNAADGLEVTFEVRLRPTIQIELHSGEQVLPWPTGHQWEVEPIDGDGYLNSWGSGGSGYWFGVSEPGRYSVKIPTIDGFLPHEPIEVELLRGKREKQTVELTPR